MTIVHITHAPDGFRLTFPYDADVVTLLKTVPPHRRKYDAILKAWTLRERGDLVVVVGALKAAGHEVRDSTGTTGPRYTGEEQTRTRRSDGGWSSWRDSYSEPPPRREPPRQGYARPPRAGNGATWADAIFAAVPPALHSRLYRSLSKVLHPDVGGSDDLMKALNAAHRKATK